MFGEKLSHYVDLPRWWVGSKVVDVFSCSAPNTIPYFEIRDNYHTTYRFSNGAVSSLTFMMGPAAHFAGDPLQDMVTQQVGDGHTLKFIVAGDKGAAETEIFGRTIKRWEYSDSPDYMISTLVENITWDCAEDHFYFHNTTDQTTDIVDRVSKGLPPKTAPRDALETMKLCFAAEQSSNTGKLVTLNEMAGN
jgi:predicted dehydrogenase